MRPPPICMLNPIIVVGTFLASVKLAEWSGQYLVLTYFFNSSKAVLDLVQSSTELNWALHSPGFASADMLDKHPLHSQSPLNTRNCICRQLQAQEGSLQHLDTIYLLSHVPRLNVSSLNVSMTDQHPSPHVSQLCPCPMTMQWPVMRTTS